MAVRTFFLGREGFGMHVVLPTDEKQCWCCNSTKEQITDPNASAVTYCADCWERGTGKVDFEELHAAD